MHFMMTVTSYMFRQLSTNIRESTKINDFSFVLADPSGVETHRELYFVIYILLYFTECIGWLMY